MSPIARALNSISSQEFQAQWQNPSDVFSVLLILGGDIIRQALAQLAGSNITPVAFSFGWVAYAVSAISSAVGENKLMPLADTDCLVIGGKDGYVRSNVNWVLGRIVRDFAHWRDNEDHNGPIGSQVKKLVDSRWDFEKEQWKARGKKDEEGEDAPEPKRPTQAGLCVSVYDACRPKIGTPGYDQLYWIGVMTIFVQLGIAAIPCGLYGDYGQILITAAGTVLALTTGALQQWRKEKWEARKNTKQNFILTRGNGSQHAIVILGNGVGLNLSDMSAVPTNVDVWTSKTTELTTVVLGLLWICLLISASGLQENSWFLMGVGAIGIVQNIYVAGRWRKPEAFGIHLKYREVIGHVKVMETLFLTEEKYPYIGRAMRDTFFPGDLFPAEDKRWDELKDTAKAREKTAKEARAKKVTSMADTNV